MSSQKDISAQEQSQLQELHNFAQTLLAVTRQLESQHLAAAVKGILPKGVAQQKLPIVLVQTLQPANQPPICSLPHKHTACITACVLQTPTAELERKAKPGLDGPTGCYVSPSCRHSTFDNLITHTHNCLIVAVLQDLAAELERERTKSVMAQQAANQEKLQARASAAESASLRRQLKELAEQLAQEKHAAGAASRSNSGQPDAQLVGCCLNQPNLFKCRR